MSSDRLRGSERVPTLSLRPQNQRILCHCVIEQGGAAARDRARRRDRIKTMFRHQVLKRRPWIVERHNVPGVVFRENITQPVARHPGSDDEVRSGRFYQRQSQLFERVGADDVDGTKRELYKSRDYCVAPFDQRARKAHGKENHGRFNPIGHVAPSRRGCAETWSQIVIDVESQIEIGEHFASPAMQYESARAVGFDDLTDVRSNDHRAARALFKQLFVRAALEALITRGNDLIDQVAVEIDCERQCEHEPGTHSRGISPERFRQKFAQLREVVDIGFEFVERFVVDARDEAHVVISGQNRMNSAGPSDRPRYAHGLFDDAAGRQFDAAEKTNQRRFAGAVSPEQSELFASTDGERYVAQNAVDSAFGPVILCYVERADHSNTRNLRASCISHKPNTVKIASTNAVYNGSP